MNDIRVPIIIVTGFLGSGKTTFINNILGSIEDKKITIIENEFAELGIDASLINKKKSTNVFELNNGCVCCTMNGELEGVFGEIIKDINNTNYIILETTGVADPSPIIKKIISNPHMEQYFRLDNVYTIVDSKNIEKQLLRNFESKKQIAFANKIVLNKIDLIGKKEIDTIKKKILTNNPEVEIIQTSYSDISMDNIFNEYGFEGIKDKNIVNLFNNFSFSSVQKNPSFMQSSHLEDITSFGIKFKEEISLPKFDFFIRSLIQKKSEEIYRIKGVVNIKDSFQPIIFQGVHDIIDWMPGPPWENNEKKETKLVFIGRDINKKQIQDYISELIKIQE